MTSMKINFKIWKMLLQSKIVIMLIKNENKKLFLEADFNIDLMKIESDNYISML